MGTETAGGTRQPPQDTIAGWRQRWHSFIRSDFVRALPYWAIPFVVMGVAVYGGIGWNIVISLTDYAGLGQASYSQLDLEMYRRALTSGAVWQAGQNTFVLLVTFTTVTLVLGLFLALMLDRGIRFKGKVQTIYLLPMSLSFVVTAQLWLWMYDYNSGVLNVILGTLGLPRIKWVGNPQIVLFALIFALIWQFSGYCMVVYLAGLRTIPNSQFEAAKVDGASTFRIYARVIVPQLKEASVSAAVVLMIFALKAFTFIYAMFGSFRPPNGSDILATLMVREAFKFTNWAYAAAIATILLLMALGVITPYLYYQYQRGSL